MWGGGPVSRSQELTQRLLGLGCGETWQARYCSAVQVARLVTEVCDSPLVSSC